MSEHGRCVCRYCRETAVLGGDVCPAHHNTPPPAIEEKERLTEDSDDMDDLEGDERMWGYDGDALR